MNYKLIELIKLSKLIGWKKDKGQRIKEKIPVLSQFLIFFPAHLPSFQASQFPNFPTSQLLIFSTSDLLTLLPSHPLTFFFSPLPSA